VGRLELAADRQLLQSEVTNGLEHTDTQAVLGLGLVQQQVAVLQGCDALEQIDSRLILGSSDRLRCFKRAAASEHA
jgi:hypothetical protein